MATRPRARAREGMWITNLEAGSNQGPIRHSFAFWGPIGVQADDVEVFCFQ